MIKLLEKRTEKDPLNHIGENAGICWGADISNEEKNIKRGKSCMKSGHMRCAEYPTVEMILDEFSARVIRETYTHIIGVTRLQESTRYVNCADFGYYTPNGITEEQKEVYDDIMKEIMKSYETLLDLGMSKEDTANMLNAVGIMRNITNMLGSSVLGKLAAATAGGLGTEVGGDVLEQNVHIDAQFPNVKDSREIEEALNNLVNMASMRANRR